MFSGGSPAVFGRGSWAGNLESFSFDNGEDVNAADPLWYSMAPHWETISAVMQGTTYLRTHADTYLPIQPLEQDSSWRGRVSRSTLSPYFAKVLRTVVGLVLRKPIYLEGGDEAYFEEWRADVCRDGSTDLDQFAQELLVSAVSMGHASVMVDFPDTSNVRTLADEQGASLKPYFVKLDAPSCIGWAQDPRENRGKLQQLRIRESYRKRIGSYGVEYKNRVRVLEPGKFEVWEAKGERGDAGWELVESGRLSVSEIPVATVYGEKHGVLYSKPPMLALAHQALDHFRKSSDLTQSLHIASQAILVGAGLEDLGHDNQNNPIGLSANNMILTPPKGDAEIYYVSPNVTSFDSQQQELERIVHEMKNLSLAMLGDQNTTNASGTAKAMDRIDSNSVLAIISKSLQQCLQEAVNIAAEYAGVQPPEVVIPRDFDLEIMEPTAVTAIQGLFSNGILDKATTLELLRHGEVIPDDIDLEEVVEATEAEELDSMQKQVDQTAAMAEIGDGTPAKRPEGE